MSAVLPTEGAAAVNDIAEAVRSGATDATVVTERALARIAAHNGELGAFLFVAADSALAQAKAIDERRGRGQTLGPLAGVPIGVKDSLCTAGLPTTAASRLLGGPPGLDGLPDPARAYRPPYDATVVARLREADAVVVGKCNLDEFAMGSSNENSGYLPARNPHDLSRTPGGSSGGSAAAVAAGLVPAALGSDTGGSVRQPAAFTGTVGVKPTYGRVSRYGLIAFASSLDQVGVIASDVRGAAAVLSAIAGHDARDATSSARRTDDWAASCREPPGSLRIGVPEEYFAAGLSAEVERCVRATLDGLGRRGAVLQPIRLPHTDEAVASYYVVATAECSSNLARFDGVRYGQRAADATDLRSLYLDSRGRGFGAEVKRRIMLGTFVLSAGYYQAYYLRAQRVRTLIKRDFERAFEQVDVIATPVAPSVAFELGSRVDDPLSMYLADEYTLPASLAGLPAISVPCGRGAASGMPVGLQLIGSRFDEGRLLQAAHAIELLP